MGTSASEDKKKHKKVMKFDVATRDADTGTLVYAGNLWPAGVANPTGPGATPKGRQMRREIDAAFADARAMVTAGYIKATAAIKGDEAAGLLMTKWFGRRNTAPGHLDWWLGSHKILGNLQTQLAKNLNVYYRGDDSLIGQPTDYPGETGNLTAQDVRGYAETGAGSGDGNIGLCKLFFRRESGGVFKTAQKGRDSIGGCLAHELSHNYCDTEDHEAYDGGDCYGEHACRRLAKKIKRRAWYNADNVEYFCEDAYFGIVASKGAISSGASSPVINVRLMHLQVADATKVPTKQQLLAQGPKGPSQVTGGVALMKAQLLSSAVVQDPTLPVPVTQPGRNKVADLLAKFGQG